MQPSLDERSRGAEAPADEWTVPAAPAKTVAARRAFAIVVAVVGGCAACAASFALALLTQQRWSLSIAILGVVGIAWWTARMWNAPPGSMKDARVRVPKPGRLEIDGVERTIRSCWFDGATELLWARGRLALPLACVQVTREVACEIADALGCPERGVRTLRALPGVFVIPWIGGLLAMVIAFGALFGIVMVIAGPPHIGVPAAAIAIPLAIVAFRPAYVELRDGSLVWRWWMLRRELPLATIDRVAARAGSLRVHRADGAVQRIQVHMANSGSAKLAHVDADRARLASFARFVERSAQRSVASVFE